MRFGVRFLDLISSLQFLSYGMRLHALNFYLCNQFIFTSKYRTNIMFATEKIKQTKEKRKHTKKHRLKRTVALQTVCPSHILMAFLVSGKGCGLWLWHHLDFSLTFFCVHFIYFETETFALFRVLFYLYHSGYTGISPSSSYMFTVVALFY